MKYLKIKNIIAELEELDEASHRFSLSVETLEKVLKAEFTSNYGSSYEGSPEQKDLEESIEKIEELFKQSIISRRSELTHETDKV